ncbi:MAG: SDR family NAD(P)-dependent oxidoreductase [Candidatus Microsaccharimonas sp.]
MNKTIIITGASDGIGKVAAEAFHEQGETVVIVGRSPEKTKAIAKELGVDYYVSDFAKLDDVKKLAKKLQKAYPKIDVLINNAGGIFGKHQVTIDGYEKTMQVNHLAHFLLTELLMDTLIASKATIINTSSIANEILSKLDIADLNMKKKHTPNSAYGNAKLENILFTKELERRYGKKGIHAVAFHPGNVATNFASNTTSVLRFMYQTPLKRLARLISPEQGADTMLWLVNSQPNVDWKPGEYYVRRKITKAHALAYDEDVAKSLWKQSEEMVKHYSRKDEI